MSTPRTATALLGLVCAAAFIAAGCRNEPGRGGTPVEVTATPLPDASATTTVPAPVEGTVTPIPAGNAGELRDLMLSSLTATATSAQMDRALQALDVETFRLEVIDRTLWFALSTGSGVYELPDATHVAGVYEHRPDGTWVEIARVVLESSPTVASAEVLPVRGASGYPMWVAVTGMVGAHGGTFELLRFDGLTLSTGLWWFSPSPDVVTLEDLDGDGWPEVILNASDPYVFCYACGVVNHGEVIYRWQGAEPATVTLVEVPGESAVASLTARAARLVEADLWREARATINQALVTDPGNADVRWDVLLISRIAETRLAQAGAPQQPLVTHVLAGEYTAAVDLLRGLDPADIFDPEGPLVAGTVAEGWETTMGEYLVDYATRALALRPELHQAYAVRAVGRILLQPATGWGEALTDLDAALALNPDDPFYQLADSFLLARAGGSRG